MFKDIYNIWDIPLIIIYLLIIFSIAFFYKNHKIEKKDYYQYFTLGLIIKIIGGLAFASIYIFYYQGGDTMYYQIGAESVDQLLFKNPTHFFRTLFTSADNFPPDLMYVKHSITYAKANEEWFMVRIMAIINLFTLQRFFIATILTSFISFLGAWKMYQTFLFFFPKEKKAAFIAVFLVPSVIFWGSGVMKDTMSLAALGFFLYYTKNLFFQYHWKISSILGFLFAAFILFSLKIYIIVSFFPPLFLAWYIYNKSKITNKVLRVLIGPILLISSFTIAYLAIYSLLESSEKYKIENLQSRLDGFHTWHSTVGGSSYNLGEIEYTPTGIIKKIPASLNVTFFRPYLWEIRNIVMAIGGLESLIFLLLFIYILIYYRLSWIRLAFKSPLLILSLTYILIFGFIVGFTSYNFGALARYKIPVLPFFTFFLLYFYYQKKNNKSLTMEEDKSIP